MLAMAQARLVAAEIEQATGTACELVTFETTGDRTAGPLAPVGGKGLFTAELEDALRDGRVDLAVHSAKDMPAELGADFVIVAVGQREDPRDALVSADGCDVIGLHEGARVGTSSPRRAAQLRALRGGIEVVALRGNIETRLRRGLGQDPDFPLDAAVVAVAGLRRAGLVESHSTQIVPLSCTTMVPAAGQAALAIEALASRDDLVELLAAVDHADSHQALLAERHVVAQLGASCHSALGVHLWPSDQQWQGMAMVARSDGSGLVRAQAQAGSAAEAGQSLLSQLLEAGAIKLLNG
jgi:hydroxymethylbilane synthase